MKIKDEVVNFFHAQGITIVTIQPEFKTKSANGARNSAIVECLIGCQSIECAPKTCCSTNDLDAILVGAESAKKAKKVKSDRKSSSLLSLNVTSLSKLRKLTGSTQDMKIKKSVSESHVTGICGDDSTDSGTPSTNASTTGNNLCAKNNSIDELKEDELKEDEFHAQCDERSAKRVAPMSQQSQQATQIQSNAKHEDSTLLDKVDDSTLSLNQTVNINSADGGNLAEPHH